MVKRRLKIAQLANIAERVPPHKYGGTERVVYALTEELVKRGHKVTLFASGDSITSARLISIYPKALRYAKVLDNVYGANILSLLNIGYAYQEQDQFDIIHDHNSYLSLPTANLSKTPVVMTMHGYFGVNEKRIFENLKNPFLVSVSKAQAASAPKLSFMGNVYHGLEMKHFPFSKKRGKYLLFTGRISMEKGVHFAIEVALYLDIPLIIAAKLDSAVDAAHDVSYFKQFVEPKLSNQIKWVGEVSEVERNKLMSGALCSLHPIIWPEPFGLTMIESMACGTPVVAFNLGSTIEVIEDAKSGYIVEDVSSMIEAVANIQKIDRQYCREYVLNRFSVENMVDGYEAIYNKVLSQNST
ncbi:hypothetical protein A3B45_01580 [Candidatus Daviesbacteria bacterium RIFCSPLOWO2_01_FULL_39_12]|uniref:Glycosyl transferase n=1 Tax=Candidatus Daviesbacteria bacterium RIFCSPLOWO2_01_FULL_39_12 TaxID=1797785 RepID=A0A1F5KNV1_9BACT|nr:MAG: hypothetical protein A3B45_01580 [Candidatus Daviesbacteria bacterium RIFCSPLOWO2_01_FULL_39_12]